MCVFSAEISSFVTKKKTKNKKNDIKLKNSNARRKWWFWPRRRIIPRFSTDVEERRRYWIGAAIFNCAVYRCWNLSGPPPLLPQAILFLGRVTWSAGPLASFIFAVLFLCLSFSFRALTGCAHACHRRNQPLWYSNAPPFFTSGEHIKRWQVWKLHFFLFAFLKQGGGGPGPTDDSSPNTRSSGAVKFHRRLRRRITDLDNFLLNIR